MATLADLKPTEKHLVMNLLAEANFDVTDWKNYKGKSPAANPKYCYNWSFEQPGEAVALCLWHPSLKQKGGAIFFSRRQRAHSGRRKGPRSNVWNKRDADFSKKIELAYRQQLPVRVIIVEGDRRNPADLKPKASTVKARYLDPISWAVVEYDYGTSVALLVRGEKPTTPAVDAYDLAMSWFEGTKKRKYVLHRQREGRARREKIKEALAKNGGRLICEVENCGFNFKERYGALGEGYAQVHHLAPLSSAPIGGRTVKLEDLAVVCANCHVMIHIGGDCRPLKRLIPAK